MLDFYVMSTPTMSTFSRDEASRLERETAFRISSVIAIPARGLLSVVDKHSGGRFPELLCVDIEGLDELVIPSIALATAECRPLVICIETLVYAESGPPRKKTELIDRVVDAGYRVYADTHINTIFCRSDLHPR